MRKPTQYLQIPRQGAALPLFIEVVSELNLKPVFYRTQNHKWEKETFTIKLLCEPDVMNYIRSYIELNAGEEYLQMQIQSKL